MLQDTEALVTVSAGHSAEGRGAATWTTPDQAVDTHPDTSGKIEEPSGVDQSSSPQEEEESPPPAAALVQLRKKRRE
jgi:hypothetical protein